MKKIRLQSLPQGQILSNEELKSVVGGIKKTIECKCSFQLSDGTSRSYGDLPDTALEDSSTCRAACATACSGYFEGTPGGIEITCTGFSSNYSVEISY